jgi:hypothetical protein
MVLGPEPHVWVMAPEKLSALKSGAGGKAEYDLGVQALLGYSIPIRDEASFNAALEIPYNFHLARTLGVTPLVGLTYRL